MYLKQYRDVSTTNMIVFTCFLISFCLPLHAQTNEARQTTKQISNAAMSANNENGQVVVNKHENLKAQVETFLYEKVKEHTDVDDNLSGSLQHDESIQVSVKPIDKRISIPHCDTDFEFTLNTDISKQSNQNIKITCPTSNWFLFVHGTVALMQDVVVSRDHLSPGTLLSTRNLEIIKVDKNRLRGSVFSEIDLVAGARIKRRIRAGNIINDRMLCFVCKGDRITIAASAGGLSVKVYGVAQEDGVLGDTIQVRNISSDNLVFGKIASTSEVKVSI